MTTKNKAKKDAEPKFKVFRVFRNSGRKKVLERNLTESEAQRLVKSFPDSDKSMVYYARQ